MIEQIYESFGSCWGELIIEFGSYSFENEIAIFDSALHTPCFFADGVLEHTVSFLRSDNEAFYRLPLRLAMDGGFEPVEIFDSKNKNLITSRQFERHLLEGLDAAKRSESVQALTVKCLALIYLVNARDLMVNIIQGHKPRYRFLAIASHYLMWAMACDSNYEKSLIAKVAQQRAVKNMGSRGGSTVRGYLREAKEVTEETATEYFRVQDPQKTQAACVRLIEDDLELLLIRPPAAGTLARWVSKEFAPEWARNRGRKPNKK